MVKSIKMLYWYNEVGVALIDMTDSSNNPTNALHMNEGSDAASGKLLRIWIF